MLRQVGREGREWYQLKQSWREQREQRTKNTASAQRERAGCCAQANRRREIEVLKALQNRPQQTLRT